MKDAPLTRYLCALVDCQMGKCTADELRERWKRGEFTGVSNETAAAYAKLHGIGSSGG